MEECEDLPGPGKSMETTLIFNSVHKEGAKSAKLTIHGLSGTSQHGERQEIAVKTQLGRRRGSYHGFVVGRHGHRANSQIAIAWTFDIALDL